MSASFRALPVTCRVCPSAFWRRSAGWTTSGRCYDDEFFRPSYFEAKLVSPAHALIQSQRCTPLDPQRFSAASERCCNCRSVPDLATGKTPKRHLKQDKLGYFAWGCFSKIP